MTPAGLFAADAAKQPVPITVGKPGAAAVDAGSVLSVLTLEARHGDQVVPTAEGEGAEGALDTPKELLQTNYDA